MQKAWLNTPRGKYSAQKRKAKQRNIPWKLTFDSWWNLWDISGKWEQRGDKKGMYCMSRHEDAGEYSIENVYINEFGKNTLECYQRNGVNEKGQFNRA